MAYCSKVGIYTASILAVQCFQTAVLNEKILTHSLIEVCVLDSFIRFSFNMALSFAISVVFVNCCLLVSSLHGLDLLAKTAKKHQHSLRVV